MIRFLLLPSLMLLLTTTSFGQFKKEELRALSKKEIRWLDKQGISLDDIQHLTPEEESHLVSGLQLRKQFLKRITIGTITLLAISPSLTGIGIAFTFGGQAVASLAPIFLILGITAAPVGILTTAFGLSKNYKAKFHINALRNSLDQRNLPTLSN